MVNNYNDFISQRRSIYHLDSQLKESESEIETLIAHALKESPSAFNCQSSRLVVLFQNAHKRFWTKTLHELKAVAPEKTHTSSGRVPSAKGYRFYVDELLVEDRITLDEIKYIANIKAEFLGKPFNIKFKSNFAKVKVGER